MLKNTFPFRDCCALIAFGEWHCLSFPFVFNVHTLRAFIPSNKPFGWFQNSPSRIHVLYPPDPSTIHVKEMVKEKIRKFQSRVSGRVKNYLLYSPKWRVISKWCTLEAADALPRSRRSRKGNRRSQVAASFPLLLDFCRWLHSSSPPLLLHFGFLCCLLVL